MGQAEAEQRQRTLVREAGVKGVGLHSGEPSTVRLLPAPEGQGIVFEVGGERIPLTVANLSGEARNTVLAGKQARVMTVEHMLSALNGLGVDNATIVMDASEPPAMDGSALAFVEAVRSAGLKEQEALRRRFRVARPVQVARGAAMAIALPCDDFRLTYILDYGDRPPGRAAADWIIDAETYEKQIAPARTFALEEEVEKLKAAGLAKGGSEENAIVVRPDGYSKPLRFEDECARHKLLDLAGDLAALGVWPCGHFIGIRSGHALNHELALLAAQQLQQ